MKIFVRILTAACLAAVSSAARAEELPATVKGDRVNVRGRATLDSEAITQLRTGETVIVIEQITLPKPGPGEPTNWARILLPANTPVWVSTLFLDPETKTVKGTKLNVRAGPGERFSVVGQLAKGDKVREIRTLEDWMEIEPPPGTYAFVAADLLDLKAPLKTPELAAKKDDKPAVPAPTPEPVKVEPPKPPEPAPITKVETVPSEPVPPVAGDIKPKPSVKPVTPAPEPIVAPPPVVVTPPPVVVTPAPKPVVPDPVVAPAPPVKPAVEEPPPKRVVEREGVVKRTWSIQAPTPYALVDTTTGQIINYLYTSDTGLQLKYYLGQRIRVSGPEALDSRWPKTPLLTIQTLQTQP
jgi:hypothetical protein